MASCAAAGFTYHGDLPGGALQPSQSFPPAPMGFPVRRPPWRRLELVLPEDGKLDDHGRQGSHDGHGQQRDDCVGIPSPPRITPQRATWPDMATAPDMVAAMVPTSM